MVAKIANVASSGMPPSIPPSVWGPRMWATIHFIALGFPESPTVAQRAAFTDFFDRILPFIIPCNECATNYRRHLRELSGLNFRRFDSASSLFEWTVALHNKVNTELGKPQLSPDEALERLIGRKYASSRNSAHGASDITPLVTLFAFVCGALFTAVVLKFIIMKRRL